jgi:hypothetical protein
MTPFSFQFVAVLTCEVTHFFLAYTLMTFEALHYSSLLGGVGFIFGKIGCVPLKDAIFCYAPSKESSLAM